MLVEAGPGLDLLGLHRAAGERHLDQRLGRQVVAAAQHQR
jgi:hypothetical protein